MRQVQTLQPAMDDSFMPHQIKNHVILPLLAVVLFLGSPGIQHAHEPVATQPSTAQPADTLDAHDCLAIANNLMAEDNFPRAVIYFQAARDRAGKDDRDIKSAAKLALDRLDLLGQTPPRLSVHEWLQGSMPPGSTLQGKVLLLFFFESIDPEAKHIIDAMNSLHDRNRKNDFELIGIASVLGDDEHQQPADIRQFVSDQRIPFRVALDEGGVMTLHTYKGRSLPHYALIDRAGRVRRLGGYSPNEIDFAVRKLLVESPDMALPGSTCVMPPSRDGRELIDTRAPRLTQKTWTNTPDNLPPNPQGKVRLIRFLMSDCPYCRATSPALNRIHTDYADKGLLVVGIYHPKPRPRDVPDDEFRRAIRRLEASFPCTIDADWAYLEKIWLESGTAKKGPAREFTSASFLLDKKGRIRYVHPGPDFFPSDKPEHARQNQDYLDLRAGIEKLLSE